MHSAGSFPPKRFSTVFHKCCQKSWEPPQICWKCLNTTIIVSEASHVKFGIYIYTPPMMLKQTAGNTNNGTIVWKFKTCSLTHRCLRFWPAKL